MRIIAGSRARMKLVSPKDKTTRPIPDMVKEALFSIIGKEIKDKIVADLFCGTGSMGLEALSRGAQHALFMDLDRDALKGLNENVDKMKFEEESTIIRADIFKYGVTRSSRLKQWQTELSTSGVDIVFLDPPFPLARETGLDSMAGKLLIKICGQIAPEAIVIFRNEKKFPTLDNYGELEIYDRRSYGIMTLHFYKKTGSRQTADNNISQQQEPVPTDSTDEQQ